MVQEAGTADIIVVGSGGGGLTAALCAARRGAKVLVLEAAAHPGGYLNPFRRRGFEFDTGLHYVGELEPGSVFRNTLERIGLWPRLSFRHLNEDGFDRFVVGEHQLSAMAGEEAMVDGFASMFPDEREGIRRYFRTAVSSHELYINRRGPTSDKPKVWRGLLRQPWMATLMAVPYEAVLRRCARSELLRAFMAAYHGCYALPPSRAAALVALFVQRHSLDGAFYPRGGSRALRDALLDTMIELGGEVRTRTKVTRIQPNRRGFEVIAGNEVFRARSVISAIDPVSLYEGVLDSSRVPYHVRSRVKVTRHSLGHLYAFIGTDLDLEALEFPRSNLMISSHADVEAVYAPLLAGRVPDEPDMVIATSTTIKDPEGGHAPPGHHTLELLALAPFAPFARWANEPSRRRSSEYQDLKHRLGMGLVKKAEQHIPGLSSHLVHVEFATPATNLSWVGAVQGSAYGVETTSANSGLLRYPIASPVEGLYLAGSGTLGPGVGTVIASGEAAADEALEWLSKNA